MISRTWTVSIVFLFALFGIYPAHAEPLPPDDLASQRAIFSRAEHALKKKDYVNYERLAEKITTYPLYPYLVYDDLKRNIQTKKSNVSLDKIQQFEQNFPDFPYNNTLRDMWLSRTAHQKSWSLFLKGYKETKDPELACYYIQAKYETTKDKAHLEKAKDYYLVGYSQPQACDHLFQVWAKTGGLNQTLIRKRTALALEEKNFTLANHLMKQLSHQERLDAQLWEKLIKNPYLLFDDKFVIQLNKNKLNTQIITNGLQILAKREPEKALKWWQTNQSKYEFSKIQTNSIQRDIGVYLAHQKHPKAREYLAQLADNNVDNVAIEWRIRLALLEKDWADALLWINRLPAVIKEDKCWRYWWARANEELGSPNLALPIYEELAKTRNYYGYVSRVRLQRPLDLHHQELIVDPTIAMRVENMPSMQRFQELHILGKEAIGRVEWFRATNKMNEEELVAAAKIAQKMELHDIAIFTIGKTDFKDDIPLRFPLAHQKEIVENAHKHNIDPAWIFGIARQESAFFNEAISHAGARGLLQLMPTTAMALAQKHKISYGTESDLHDPSTNLKIGTVYLKNLKEQLYNHTILATASYNAGPTRVGKWLPTTPIESDIWIESIPYRETREYVKNVLTFTSIYRQRLNYSSALALMMKPIPAKST